MAGPSAIITRCVTIITSEGLAACAPEIFIPEHIGLKSPSYIVATSPALLESIQIGSVGMVAVAAGYFG